MRFLITFTVELSPTLHHFLLKAINPDYEYTLTTKQASEWMNEWMNEWMKPYIFTR